MTRKQQLSLVCSICGQAKNQSEFVAGGTIRDPVVVSIQRQYPNWAINDPVCFACLNQFRADHVRALLEEERGDLSSLEEQVIQSLREQEAVSENVNEQFEQQLTLGDRLSDRMAAFGGSWSFLIAFAVMIVCWMTFNSSVFTRKAFDPFPFILLNLILSCLAAVQAPVILMSQNRQEEKDRMRSENDYLIDLKSELEVKLLHTKLDQLLTHQWQRLLEIQQLQMELMEEVANTRRNTNRRGDSK